MADHVRDFDDRRHLPDGTPATLTDKHGRNRPHPTEIARHEEDCTIPIDHTDFPSIPTSTVKPNGA